MFGAAMGLHLSCLATAALAAGFERAFGVPPEPGPLVWAAYVEAHLSGGSGGASLPPPPASDERVDGRDDAQKIYEGK